MITGQDDAYPFAWAEIGVEGELLGVAVIFAHWFILWPLFSVDADAATKQKNLERGCFINWVAQIKEDFRTAI